MNQVPASTPGGDATFVLLDGDPGAPAAGGEADILQGLDLGFAGLLRFVPDPAKQAPFLEPGLAQLQSRLDAARAAYDATAPEKTLPSLQRLLMEIRALAVQVRGSAIPPDARGEVVARLDEEEVDVEIALTRAHGVEVEAVVDDELVVPGQDFLVTTTIANNGAGVDPDGRRVAEPDPRAGRCCSWRARDRELGPGERAVYRHRVFVPRRGGALAAGLDAARRARTASRRRRRRWRDGPGPRRTCARSPASTAAG